MESSSATQNRDATVISINESKSRGKGKDVTFSTSSAPKGGAGKGVAILDFVLRLMALTGALAATAIMSTAEQVLPFFTQFFQFHAEYDDFEVFTFFIAANGVVAAYLVLSLPFSIVGIVRPHVVGPRLLLLIGDIVMVAITMASAAATASIVYLAHNGNENTNWLAICGQFGDFCKTTSEAVISSFIAGTILIVLVVVSAIAIKRT